MADLDLDALDALAADTSLSVRLHPNVVALASAVPVLTARVRELEASVRDLDEHRAMNAPARAERDEARAEVARLRAQVDAVTALCDEADAAIEPGNLRTRAVRAALASAAPDAHEWHATFGTPDPPRWVQPGPQDTAWTHGYREGYAHGRRTNAAALTVTTAERDEARAEASQSRQAIDTYVEALAIERAEVAQLRAQVEDLSDRLVNRGHRWFLAQPVGLVCECGEVFGHEDGDLTEARAAYEDHRRAATSVGPGDDAEVARLHAQVDAVTAWANDEEHHLAECRTYRPWRTADGPPTCNCPLSNLRAALATGAES